MYFKLYRLLSSLLSKKICILEGVICIISTFSLFNKSDNAEGICCSSSFAITNFNPFCKQINVSNINMSKLIVVTETTTFWEDASCKKLI